MVPDRQTVLGVKNTRLVCTLGRNAPQERERILLCKLSLMAMALQTLFALHLLALLAAGIPHPGGWGAALTLPGGNRARCRGDNVPRRPLRACPASQKIPLLPLKRAPENTKCHLDLSEQHREGQTRMGTLLAGCSLSTGKIGGELQSPPAACRGDGGRAGDRQGLSPKL